MFRFLFRCTLIVLGYAGAIAGAGAVLLVAVIGLEAGDLTESRPAFLLTWLMTSLMIGYWSFLPALIIIVVGEALRRRDWLFHSLAGGIATLAILAWHDGSRTDGEFALAAIAAGLAGGWVYWLIAVRNAPPPSGS